MVTIMGEERSSDGFFSSMSGSRIVRTYVVDKGEGGCGSGGSCLYWRVRSPQRATSQLPLPPSAPRPSTVPEKPILVQHAVRVDNGNAQYSP